jgi:hypothetical protein
LPVLWDRDFAFLGGSQKHDHGDGSPEDAVGRGVVTYGAGGVRGDPTDLGAADNFGDALFECPDGFKDDGFKDVARLVQQLCPADEWPEIARALANFPRA